MDETRELTVRIDSLGPGESVVLGMAGDTATVADAHIGEMDKAAWRAVLDACSNVYEEVRVLAGLEYKAAPRIGDAKLRELAGRARETLIAMFGGPGMPWDDAGKATDDMWTARAEASTALEAHLAPSVPAGSDTPHIAQEG